MRRLIFIIGIVTFTALGAANGEYENCPKHDTATIITHSNIGNLKSTETEFKQVSRWEFITGWFALSPNAEYLARIAGNNEVVMWCGYSGDVALIYSYPAVALVYEKPNDRYPSAAVEDLAFSDDSNWLVSLHGEDGMYYAANLDITLTDVAITKFPNLAHRPVSIWAGDILTYTWSEVIPDDPLEQPYILGLPVWNNTHASVSIPYSLASDMDAIVRIGRVPPPFAVTSSADGVVKRWNLQTGEVTAQAKVEGGPVVFGQINASSSHLAWRDPESKALHLLNFDTGEDKVVASLDGQYIQFMFLTLNADVIIGVNIDLQPIVVAWDVATGQRYDLGEYRQCSRVPDMARLSKDGTTLVIGCDAGLDIWRLAED